MAALWTLVVLFWTWTPPCLPSSVTFIGSPQECKRAQFVPGYNLGGEGFDIVTMERKGAYVIDTETWTLGNGTCRLYQNVYMNEKQKVPASVVDWRIFPQCELSVSSKLYESAESLINDSTSAVTNSWKIGLDIPGIGGVGFGGSHSRASNFAAQKSKQDRYTFLRHSVHCKFYRYRLTAKPPLSHEFGSAVNSLPPYSSGTQQLYHDLIDTYGTHYSTQVSLGGEVNAITAAKTCMATLSKLSGTEVKDCLSVEASASFKSPVSISAMFEHCKNKKKSLGSGQTFSSMFSERDTIVTGGNLNSADVLFKGQSDPSVYDRWIDSLKTIPGVVRYSLKPLHTILPYAHPAQAGLKQEVENYIKRNAMSKKCSESCNMGQRSNRRDPCDCVCYGNQMVESNCCPAEKGLATLTVFRLYAKDLYGDVHTQTDGSVEVKYGDQITCTSIIPNDDNPRWSETLQFEPITLNMWEELKLSVYDEDTRWNSDLLGKCFVKLQSGTFSRSCTLNHGTLFLSYTVKCAPSLGGNQCQDYIRSPMSSSLARVFYTRNGVLVGDTDGKCQTSL
ncbi:perforin-1-like [Brachyistius frenatus]|uniref:perforin-1-like n=1 Tax=Brachyistius frenatus TaxID=100188 RepID=UPI0037E8EAC2